MSHYNLSRAMNSVVPCDNAERGLVGGGACGPWLYNPLPTCLTPPTIALLIKGHFPLKIQSLSFKSPDYMSGIALHQPYAVFMLRLIHSVSLIVLDCAMMVGGPVGYVHVAHDVLVCSKLDISCSHCCFLLCRHNTLVTSTWVSIFRLHFFFLR